MCKLFYNPKLGLRIFDSNHKFVYGWESTNRSPIPKLVILNDYTIFLYKDFDLNPKIHLNIDYWIKSSFYYKYPYDEL